APARAVDEYVDRTDLRLDRLGEGVDRGLVGQVDGDELCLLPLAANRGRCRLALFLRHVGHDDRRAGLGERLGRCLPDAGCGTGDDGHLVFEVHGTLLGQFTWRLLRNSATFAAVSGSWYRLCVAAISSAKPSRLGSPAACTQRLAATSAAFGIALKRAASSPVQAASSSPSRAHCTIPRRSASAPSISSAPRMRRLASA